jgi:hypothetical protein
MAYTEVKEAAMERLRRRLNYANVVATLALVVAVAGGATAAAGGFRAPKNSVTSKSIKPGNVTAGDLTTARRLEANGTVGDGVASDGNFTNGGTQVNCPSGSRPIGGGVSTEGVNRVVVTGSVMSATGWAGAVSSDAGGTQHFTVTAWCLSGKPGKPTSG